MAESDIFTGTTRDRCLHEGKSIIVTEVVKVTDPTIDSRPSSPDSLIKLLPEALDGPISLIDTGISRKILLFFHHSLTFTVG